LNEFFWAFWNHMQPNLYCCHLSFGRKDGWCIIARKMRDSLGDSSLFWRTKGSSSPHERSEHRLEEKFIKSIGQSLWLHCYLFFFVFILKLKFKSITFLQIRLIKHTDIFVFFSTCLFLIDSLTTLALI